MKQIKIAIGLLEKIAEREMNKGYSFSVDFDTESKSVSFGVFQRENIESHIIDVVTVYNTDSNKEIEEAVNKINGYINGFSKVKDNE